MEIYLYALAILNFILIFRAIVALIEWYEQDLFTDIIRGGLRRCSTYWDVLNNRNEYLRFMHTYLTLSFDVLALLYYIYTVCNH